MEKRHFEAIAAAIRDAKEGAKADPIKQTLMVAEFIADECGQFNPRFDRRRFLKACGFDAL